MADALDRYFARAIRLDTDTWISIHHRGKHAGVPGSGHQDLVVAKRDAEYWAGRADVWLSQATYRTAGPARANWPHYHEAIRLANNIAFCHKLYMDLDVKEKGYATSEDALAALNAFIAASGIPYPTIIISSGSGGFHVYWTVDEVFDEAEFRKLAAMLVNAGNQHGLLFDPQCTSDPTRLLRPPGTYNYKDPNNPKLVEFVHDSGKDITLKDLHATLAPYKSNSQSKSTSHIPAAPEGFSSGDADKLTDGVASYAPANIDTVALNCAVIRDTLANAGKDLVDESHWKLMVGLSCACEQPSATLHRLVSGNAYYNYDDTEKKLGVALQARQQRGGIGPEKCATIQNIHKFTQCDACPYRDLGTSPVSVQFKKPVPSTGTAPIANTNPLSFDLPNGYWRDASDSVIFRKNAEGKIIIAFEHPILPGSGFIEGPKPFKLSFDTMLGGKQVNKSFETALLANTAQIASTMANDGLSITGDDRVKITRNFFMSYLKLLADKSETLIEAPAHGWSPDGNGEIGFAFAGEYVTPNGNYKCKRAGDGSVLTYRVQGDDAIWRNLASIVLTPDRPDLAVMVAASFAAPLVKLSGEQGFIMGTWSPESGIGKSTALRLGQAVWSEPIVGGLTDTVNYVFAKAGELRNLPLLHDEIKGDPQIKTFCDIIFQLSGGHGKGRADRHGNMRAVVTFETLIGYASNTSIFSAVQEHHQGTDASVLRVFEMRAREVAGRDQSYVATLKQLLQELPQNYGGIGRIYATYLGQNYNALKAIYRELNNRLNETLKPTQDERFWGAAIVTTILGAITANSLGVCNFPIPQMLAFMIAEFKHLRILRASGSSDFQRNEVLVGTIGAFLTEKATRSLVILDRTKTTAGRPSKQTLMQPKNEDPNKVWGSLDVQLSGDPLTLRISDPALGEWCKRTNRPKPSLTQAMQQVLGAKLGMRVIGSGSSIGGSKVNCWDIAITPGSLLDGALDWVERYELKP